ncbi:hypothetical protein [Streptomyces sp. 061-3]|uniref:hypothetical protein n=1 Tax=Streptomyces sp. 061-3 TaxID=2789268 RepID=UPI00397EF03E
MDAGLAAVLGATVGALGTGGAGIITALFSRSQARLQIRAEHARLLREPRKATYVVYAAAARKLYETLDDAETELSSWSTDNLDEREEALRIATEMYRDAEAQESAWDHLEAQVYIEGPIDVTDAAIDLGASMVDFMGAIASCIYDREEETMPERLAPLRDQRRDTYRQYIAFLHRASDAADIERRDGGT